MPTFNINNEGIEITSGGVLNVINRSTSATVDSFDLNEKGVDVSKSGSNFTIVGKDSAGKGMTKLSDTGVSGNSVSLDTNGEMQNIGSGGPYDIDNGACQIFLDSGDLDFYK